MSASLYAVGKGEKSEERRKKRKKSIFPKLILVVFVIYAAFTIIANTNTTSMLLNIFFILLIVHLYLKSIRLVPFKCFTIFNKSAEFISPSEFTSAALLI